MSWIGVVEMYTLCLFDSNIYFSTKVQKINSLSNDEINLQFVLVLKIEFLNFDQFTHNKRFLRFFHIFFFVDTYTNNSLFRSSLHSCAAYENMIDCTFMLWSQIKKNPLEFFD